MALNEEITKLEKKIYKVNNDNESLFKLNELFNTMGLKIDFDYRKEEAYINIYGKSIKMKKGSDCFYIKILNKLIAFSFAPMNLMFNYGVIIDVIIATGKDIQYLEYCQGKSFDNFDHPYTIYLNYKNGKLNQFYSDNRYIEFTRGNTVNFKLAELIKSWDLDYKHSIFEHPYYHEFGCGTKEEKIREFGKIFLPTSSLDIVNKLKGRKKDVIVDRGQCLFEDYEYYLKPRRKMDCTRLAFYDSIPGHTIIEPNLPENGATYPDQKCLDFSLDIVSLEEARFIYEEVVNEIKNEEAYAYISSYFGQLIESVKCYQNKNNDNGGEEPPIHFLELKNK